jgi:hypothetical protein
VARGIGDLWGSLMTDLLGTIETPDGFLRLDHDVPPLPGEPFVPPDVDRIVVDELQTLLALFDKSEGDGRGSRAINWVSFDDRMNFIANLFRSRHHHRELFQMPFDAETLADIQAGRTPVPATVGARP